MDQDYEPAQNLESQTSNPEISSDYAENQQITSSYANLEENEIEKDEDSYETQVSIENEAEQSFETEVINPDEPQTELEITQTEPTEQPSIDQLTTMINELEEKINENESTDTNTELEQSVATLSNEINIDESAEKVEIDENVFHEQEQPEQLPEVVSDPAPQNADTDLMKKMMAMMTPEQLAQLNMPSVDQPAEQQPATQATSSFLSSLNPFSQSQTSVPEELPEERHIFNPAEEQAPVSAYDQTLQDFQNNPVNQALPENPPAIDAFNQGYESRESFAQLPHEAYGQSQQQFATMDQQQHQYQQQAYQQQPYQQQYAMQQPQSDFSSQGLVESQSTNLVENYQNLPLPPAPIQINTDNSMQQPMRVLS